MHDIALPAMQDPGPQVAWSAAIVRDSSRGDVVEIFFGFFGRRSAVLEGSRQLIEYRTTGFVPDRMTPQREKALAALGGRQGTMRELADQADVSDAVLRGLVNAGAMEAVAVDADRPLACPDPDHS